MNIIHGLTARDAMLIAGWMNGSGDTLPPHLDDEYLDERFSITKSTSEAEADSAPAQKPTKVYGH